MKRQRRNEMKILGLAGVLLLTPLSTFAQASFTQEGPTLNRKVRNLGMGNVGVAIRGTADSSPFYNPAGLNDVEKGRFQFLSFTGEVSADALSLVQDVKDLLDDVDAQDNTADKIRIYDQFLKDNTPNFKHVRFTMDIFNYARKNFATGLLLDERFDAAFRDLSNPRMEVQNLGDVAAYVSGAHDFWDKLLQVGVTLRPTVRFSLDEADEQISFADVVGTDPDGDSPLENKLENIKRKRFGVGADLGMKSNLGFPIIKSLPGYDFLKPSIGFTWQDIGTPNFGGAPDNKQSMSVGIAVHPDFGILKNTVALDIRDLNRDQDFLHHLHFGIESMIDWALSFGIRGGLNQGYLTGGLTIDLWAVKLDAAVYYEEVGVVTSKDSDMRWAATISFNI
jgi:hypothetical protein